MKEIILIGGGGHCKSVIDAAESSGYNILGILDTSENVGKSVCGINIIGTDDKITAFVKDAVFIISVGYIKNPILRLKLYCKVKQTGGRLATIVASTAHVSKYAAIGEGTVVLHQSCVNAGAKIGVNCIVNTFANIEHDVQIGDHTHVSTGAMVNGGCVIGSSVLIGSQSAIKQGINISDNVLIGASSYVNNDICETGTYAGIPARKIK
jgi:sugar O-acyltransferase (sialic acid O-acetyltransferase NeuD family)